MTDDAGLLVVVTGPSGVGKGTVLRCVLERVAGAEMSVSATTRPARHDEVDGVHYHFLDAEEFHALVAADGLLEWATYLDRYYGTPVRPVQERVAAGAVVILEIELEGARQVRRRVPDALQVFLAPPSMDELERRLRTRGTETEEQIQRRLQIAEVEYEAREEFDEVVVNDDVEVACERIVSLIRDARRGGRVPGGH
jgi:guanylate kinase